MNAKASGWGSSAYGVSAKAQSTWSTAVGDWAEANTTNGVGGTAIGATAKAYGQYTTAVGLGAEATGGYSTTLGMQAKATGGYSTALGMQAKATQKNSVALGAGSVDRAATKETKGTITLSDGTIREYGNFAGSNPIGVVSVGAKDKDEERQIINVAAGKISADSTDAVNGSQLYSLAGEVGKNAEAIAKNTQDISDIKKILPI